VLQKRAPTFSPPPQFSQKRGVGVIIVLRHCNGGSIAETRYSQKTPFLALC
jgi:hypothetical protein